MNATTDFLWCADEVISFRGTVYVTGWAFHSTQAVVAVSGQFPAGPAQPLPRESYGTTSPDVAAVHGPAAGQCRFTFQLACADPEQADGLELIFHLADGSHGVARRLAAGALANDAYHRLCERFFAALRAEARPPRVLEVGSRARSGNSSRARLPVGCDYVGLDLKPGENVDAVGDAHALSAIFPAGHFDAVFSISTFEHLIMPWKAALEINRVLRPGGTALICTHQTFPLHEVPWDFFRFSDRAWLGLFNAETGFEIVDTALGEPAAVVPRLVHTVTRHTDRSAAFIGSAVRVRKVSETTLSWAVDAAALVADMYPH